MCRSLLRAAAMAALVLLVAPAGPARAAALEVTPVVTEMAPGQGTAVLTVTNRGTTPAAAQVRAHAWSQPNGVDRLEPTSDLLVSPPIFELAPGRSQTVRLVLRGGAAATERAFRLLVDEIPPPGQQGTVRLALRLSLPVFVQPPGDGAPRLEWRLSDGRELVVMNRGNRRARLMDVALAGSDGGRTPLAAQGTPWLLPGAERRWPLAGRPARTTARVTGTGEAGPFAVDVPVGR